MAKALCISVGVWGGGFLCFPTYMLPWYLFHSVATCVVGGLNVWEEHLLRECDLLGNLQKRPE